MARPTPRRTRGRPRIHPLRCGVIRLAELVVGAAEIEADRFEDEIRLPFPSASDRVDDIAKSLSQIRDLDHVLRHRLKMRPQTCESSVDLLVLGAKVADA